MMRTDLGLHASVSAAVRAALGRQAADVRVIVCDGVVTLGGAVDTPEEKAAVERAVQGVPGVHAVAEGLSVRQAHAATLTDEMLAHAALEALATGEHPIGRDVTIRVQQGWLSLGGTVASPTEYLAVERALECLPVRGMTSEVHATDIGERTPDCPVAPHPV
jgi:osmotically-inducible protein OsmY